MPAIALSSRIFTFCLRCSCFTCVSWSMKSFTHLITSYSCRRLCIRDNLLRCSYTGMARARVMEEATSSTSVGFTRMASLNSLAAPASSLKINPPRPHAHLATYSLPTTSILPVHGKNDICIFQVAASDLITYFADLRIVGCLMKFIIVDADGEKIDPDYAVLILQVVKVIIDSQEHFYRMEKMLHVVIGVKTDEVGPHNSLQES